MQKIEDIFKLSKKDLELNYNINDYDIKKLRSKIIKYLYNNNLIDNIEIINKSNFFDYVETYDNFEDIMFVLNNLNKEKLFDNYEILEEIDKGEYGIVFKGKDKRNDELIVIKKIKKNFHNQM